MVFVKAADFEVLKSDFFTYSNRAQAGLLDLSPSGKLRTDGVQIVELRHRESGQEVLMINTHHESYASRKQARQREEWWALVRKLAEAHPNAIVVFGGDFNADIGKRVLPIMQGLAFVHANPHDREKTYPAGEMSIDMVAVAAQNTDAHVRMKAWRVVKPLGHNNVQTSDHQTVMASIAFQTQVGAELGYVYI
jgi:hypothetical protein